MKITIEIPDQLISDTLTAALEGGSNHWYGIVKKVLPLRWVYEDPLHMKERNISDIPLTTGGKLLFIDQLEGVETVDTYVLDIPTIKRGLEIMAEKYPDHLEDLINAEGDAITGDVFLQCCLFGDVIYG